MLLSQYERELIARSVAADRLREADEIRERRRAVELVSRSSRPAAGRALRRSIGMLLIRLGSRVAGLNARLVPECN